MCQTEKFYTYKKPSNINMMLGSCENVNTVVQLVTIPSRQLNCNTVFILLQELIAKGGDIYVDF